MDKAENEGLKVEDISVDKNSIKQISLKDQILKLAQDAKVKRERRNVVSLLDELEETFKENEMPKLDGIEVGTIEVGKENLEKNKPEDSREERD